MEIKYFNASGSTVFHYGRVPYITFKSFDGLDFIRHGFSTRLGGVSHGIYESMNLCYTRGDDAEAVRRNFSLIGGALKIAPEDMVYAMQTHTANVMEATDTHRGMGVVRPRDYDGVDGLVTDVPGIALVTTYADCVPVFLADPVKKAIGLAHSGWRGTVNNIAQAAVNRLSELYGSKPENIRAFIGPSICRSCYEVGEDVAGQFAEKYGEDVFLRGVLRPVEPYKGKFLLDLHTANKINLINAGILEKNIGITDICTCCNPSLLFSHRASKGQRGGMCGFLQIAD